MSVIIPEIILLQSLQNVIKYIRNDYNTAVSNGDETKSLLYLILNSNDLQRYSLFTQAKSVFITTPNDPRHIEINLFFNAKRAGIPTIHITLPSENEKNNTIGIGEGFRDTYFDEDNLQYRRTFNRRFNTKYSLIITSDNSNEVVLIYHFLRSVIVSLTEHLNQSLLQNIKLSGSDISINQELVPTSIFARSLGIDMEYNVEAFDLFTKDMTTFDLLGITVTPIIPDEFIDESLSF